MAHTKLPHIKYGSLPDSRFNAVQLRHGTKVEMEHTRSKRLAKMIAKSHLVEHAQYYKYLAVMERRLKKLRRH